MWSISSWWNQPSLWTLVLPSAAWWLGSRCTATGKCNLCQKGLAYWPGWGKLVCVCVCVPLPLVCMPGPQVSCAVGLSCLRNQGTSWHFLHLCVFHLEPIRTLNSCQCSHGDHFDTSIFCNTLLWRDTKALSIWSTMPSQKVWLIKMSQNIRSYLLKPCAESTLPKL